MIKLIKDNSVKGMQNLFKDKIISVRIVEIINKSFLKEDIKKVTLQGKRIIVEGSMYLNQEELPKFPGGYLLYSVSGDFYCDYKKLTSLLGSPEIVKGTFSCDKNYLTNLVGGPKVARHYSCNRCNLTSLYGAPETVKGHFLCESNLLETLEYSPRQVGGQFNCMYNLLTSLEGAPELVKGDFLCRNNRIPVNEPHDFVKGSFVN